MPPPQRDPFALCGTTIDGKYRVISIVGEGGFGVVYKGQDEGFGEPVAIKCLRLPAHVDAAAQDELIAKLRDEGRLLRRLSQRTTGILQAHDVGSFGVAGHVPIEVEGGGPSVHPGVRLDGVGRSLWRGRGHA